MNVLVTGGQGDLAKYITTALIEQGHNVDAPSRHELDVSSVDSVTNFFENEHYDAVVNAAGTLYLSLVADSNPLLWIKDIQVNLIGSYLICRAAIKANKSVKLINVASTAAFHSYKDWTSYCAAKAGVVTLSKGLYKDDYHVVVLYPVEMQVKLRDSLAIDNLDIMTIAEGAAPILDAVINEQNGKLVFYRKNEHREEEL